MKWLTGIVSASALSLGLSVAAMNNDPSCLDSYRIKLYGEKWIKASGGYSTIWLNRDTGEMSWGRGSDARKYPCKVINYTELPRVNDEGKKF